jgi:hypothetical protein
MEDFRYKMQCRANYMALVNNILYPLQPGTARCLTPVKLTKLDGLVAWMNEEGLDADYMIRRDSDGVERVILVWDKEKNISAARP